MSFPLKPISADAIPAAFEKVNVYRGLNDPVEAESICLDILDADPANQLAWILLLLCRSDQIEQGLSPQPAREVLPKLTGDYERSYYAGIICERNAKAIIRHGRIGTNHAAYEQLRIAMEYFETAEALRPPGHDDAILRWNACVRMLQRHPELAPRPVETVEAVMGE